MQVGIACDLCGRVDAETHLALPEQSPFKLVRCRRCGLVYLDPRPSPDEMERYYPPQYYTSLPPSPHAPFWKASIKRVAYQACCQYPVNQSVLQRINRAFVRGALDWRVRRRVPVLPRGCLLDVGCGNGEWLAWIRDNIAGWQVAGVETNPYAAAQARASFGLEIYDGNLPDLPLPAGHYDMVTFWHSLEHVPSPGTALRAAHRLLRRGGWLGIEVPNIESWEAWLIGNNWYHLAIPFHLYHFSDVTLSRLLTQAGFQVRKTDLVRGRVGVVDAIIKSKRRFPSVVYPMILEAARVLGYASPWAIRLYAVKP